VPTDPLLIAGLLFGLGLVTSVLNTLAGGGSFLLLPVLVALGLPADVANGTTRLGVWLQSASAWATFRRQGAEDRVTSRSLLLPTLAGGLAGALLATQLSARWLQPVFGVAFLTWAALCAMRPERFFSDQPAPRPVGRRARLLAGAIGLWGGFLQAGVGFPLIALLVSHLGRPPVTANATKVFLVLAYTSLALPLFAVAGDVRWSAALPLALGAVIGGHLGARWQLRSGAGVVRWAVVVMVTVSGVLLLRR
jgi:hypothetical protein